MRQMYRVRAGCAQGEAFRRPGGIRHRIATIARRRATVGGAIGWTQARSKGVHQLQHRMALAVPRLRMRWLGRPLRRADVEGGAVTSARFIT